jgi:hypothetical protein
MRPATNFTLLAAVIAAAFAFVVAPAGAATVVSGQVALPVLQNGSVYYVLYHRSGASSVVRKDLTTGVATTLLTTPARTVITMMRGGGGRLAIETSLLGQLTETSQVIVFELAAGTSSVIATGTYRDPEREDCGTYVRLRDVSDGGEVLVGAEQRKRATAICGDTVNADTTVLTAYAADGSGREVFNRTGTVKRRGTFYDRFMWGARLVNNRLLVASTSATSLEVTNLTTGVLTTYEASRDGNYILNADIDENGRVVVSEIGPASKASRSTGLLLLYPTAGDAANNVTVRRGKGTGSAAIFCGSQLVEDVAPFDSLELPSKLYLRDGNGTLMRRLLTGSRLAPVVFSWSDCDGATLVTGSSSARTGQSKLFTLPLT